MNVLLPDSDCSQCFNSGVFGVDGLGCNETVGCVCPEGFSGVDDWETTESCRVNDQARKTLHTVLLGFSVVGMFICLSCTLILLKSWKFCCFGSETAIKSQPLVSPNESYDNEDSPVSLETTLSRSQVKKKANNLLHSRRFFKQPKRTGSYEFYLENLRNWRRGTGFIKLCLTGFILCLTGAIYHTWHIKDFPFSRSEGNHLLDFIMSLVHMSAELCGVFMIRCYFYSLPNVTKYGGLLGLSNFIIRHPDFAYKCSVGFAISILSITPICFFIFPLIDDDLRSLGDKLGVLFLTCYTVLEGILILFLVKQVKHILVICLQFSSQKIFVNDTKQRTTRQLKAIESALRASNLINVTVVGALLIMLPAQTIDVFYDFGEDYVVYNFTFLCYYIGAPSVSIGAIYLDANFKKNTTQ